MREKLEIDRKESKKKQIRLRKEVSEIKKKWVGAEVDVQIEVKKNIDKSERRKAGRTTVLTY